MEITNPSGVKVHKIYGKKGRQVRAKEVVENRIKMHTIQLNQINKEMDKHEKDSKYYNAEKYKKLISEGILYDDKLRKAEQELKTLKSRI